MKLKTILDSAEAVNFLRVNDKIPAAVSYKLKGLVKQLTEAAKHYQEVREELLKKYEAVANETTKKYDFPTKEAEEAFIKEIDELMESEVEVNVEQISVSRWLEKVPISEIMMETLDWLLVG